LSFTIRCKGHSIYAGPERASRNLLRLEEKQLLTKSQEVPLKEFIPKSIEYYLQTQKLTFITHPKNEI
jgi:hypothetical protein